MARWVTSDWHLGEDPTIRQRGFTSVTAQDAKIRENFNRVVQPRDMVYHLGDVLVKSVAKSPNNMRLYQRFLKTFNGRKVLFSGNHDEPIPDEWFGEAGFHAIIPQGKPYKTQIVVDGERAMFTSITIHRKR